MTDVVHDSSGPNSPYHESRWTETTRDKLLSGRVVENQRIRSAADNSRDWGAGGERRGSPLAENWWSCQRLRRCKEMSWQSNTNRKLTRHALDVDLGAGG